MVNLTFYGAARTTTGSMHLVEANGLRILLDCGLYQGHRKEAFELNRTLPFDPAKIDALVLSHAHVDHCGNIPSLVRRGFRGPIYCTAATRDLSDILLRDSAYLQRNDLERVNRKRKAQGKVLFEMLYDIKDVNRTLPLFRPEPLHAAIDIGNGVYAVLHEAGHILGSAFVELIVQDKGGGLKRLVFSGDLGQTGQPILNDPAPLPAADALIIESTYANRDHPSLEDVRGRLKGFIEDIHQQRARLIIPAFSVGRTQQLLYYIGELLEQRRIPPTPIFVDSPLSTKATKIYAKHRECYDQPAAARLRAGRDPLKFPGLRFVDSVEQSMALNEMEGPMIIIAASGMCEGGRILHHLKHGIGNPRNIVLIVGFQAEHTLGRRLVERRPVVRIFGDEYPLEARIHTINALSAHADRTGLMKWFHSSPTPPRRVFAVHGDEAQCKAMVSLLKRNGAPSAIAPVRGQKARIR
ncbi:MAG: MBL fold metallo-hydrolase [Kiritimatiellia bacterium]|jgi:metallo-beta-lactamase family protein